MVHAILDAGEHIVVNAIVRSTARREWPNPKAIPVARKIKNARNYLRCRLLAV